MYQHCLIALLLVVFLVGCTAPPPEKADQDPNVTPEGVRITPDVIYGHKFGMALTFDMYQPQNQNGAGVIWINSGGFRSFLPNFYKQTTDGLRLATLDDYEQMTPPLRDVNITQLLTRGFTVFAVRHGSSPKFDLAEIVSDLRRAVRFIRFHASDYGIDAERLGLWGGSAGGHLALFLGNTAEIGNSEAAEEFEKDTGRVAAVVAYFPLSDLIKQVANDEQNASFTPATPILQNMTEEQLGEFSPINQISSDDPPTLIVHGDKDTEVPINQGESMHQALLKAGIESKFITISGAGHGFEGKDADRALAEAISWFEEHLID